MINRYKPKAGFRKINAPPLPQIPTGKITICAMRLPGGVSMSAYDRLTAV